jgi:hypothetical protein
MANLDKDQTPSEPMKEEQRPRPKRTLSKGMIRLLAVIAGVIIIVVIIVVAVTASSRGVDVATYQQYMNSVSSIVKQSDAIGADLAGLLTNPGETTRQEVQTHLDQYISTSESLEAEATKLKAPDLLVKNGADQFFLLVMQFRYKGLQNLKPSLMTALEVQDVDVSAQQISGALSYLTTSDFLYREVFIEKAAAVLKDKNMAGVSVPSSQFLTDPDLASQTRVKDVLNVLKSTGNLQAVHGVAVVKVVELPSEKVIADGGTYNLASTDSLQFKVTFENQGNMAEKDVPVSVELSSPNSSQTQKKVVTVPEIKPKEQVTVTITGLNPTPYGERWTLKVDVGPVNGEKVKDNNTIEASVIFML